MFLTGCMGCSYIIIGSTVHCFTCSICAHTAIGSGEVGGRQQHYSHRVPPATDTRAPDSLCLNQRPNKGGRLTDESAGITKVGGGTAEVSGGGGEEGSGGETGVTGGGQAGERGPGHSLPGGDGEECGE